MTITIKLKTDNEAFDGDYYQGEVNAILQDAVRRISLLEREFRLRDSNGNTVGSVTVKGK